MALTLRLGRRDARIAEFYSIKAAMPSTASISMSVAIFAGSFFVVGNIDDLLVIHQAEAKPIEPTAAPEYIPLDARVGKKVDRCRGLSAKNLNRDFVSVCLKPAICRRICFAKAFLDPQAERFSITMLKQAIASA